MAITLNVELGYEFEVHAKAKDVFAVLSDVPTSASFYPSVESITDLGKGVYRWEMEKIGLPQISFQTVYASKYTSNKAKGTVVWKPIADEGNTLVTGDWQITAGKKSTTIVLHVEVELTLPLPGLAKLVVGPLVEAEFERLTEQYIDNLIEHFGGEA